MPSHNCINNSQCSVFKVHSWASFSRDSMKFLIPQELQSISLVVVEISGIEPLTSCLQGRRSPSWAKPPDLFRSLLKWWAKMGSLSLKLFASDHHFYLLKWWAKMDSNHRPHDYQSCALASWAIGPYQLHFFWWRLAGSNRWPPACKAGALPAELNPHIIHQFSSYIK